MATNTLQTRIKSKIDYLANWNSNTTFIPLLGEICIAIIPRNISGTSKDSSDGEAYIGYGITDSLGVTGVEGGPNVNVGLTPYAIGIKVGDNTNTFANLPWVQAIAGDVYAWAKTANPPSASNISATYGNNVSIDNVQDAIDEIRDSLGNIVAGNVNPDTLSSALEALQAQLEGGGTQTLFESNPLNNEDPPTPTYPAKIIRTLVKNGLSISTTSSQITPQDLPDLPFSKITGINYPNGHTYADSTAVSPNPLSYVDSEVQSITNSISGAMSFIGIVRESDLGLDNENQQITIEDGSTLSSIVIREGNTTQTITNLIKGSVILYDTGITNEQNVYIPNMHKEFVWTGAEWKELGDENSFIVKGTVTNSDIVVNAGILQTKIAGSSNYTDLSDELSAMSNLINGKVDKVTGKGLSTEDFTSDFKNKLNLIEDDAQVNVIESISVNEGTPITPDSNKNVDITMPTITFTNNGSTVTIGMGQNSATFNPIAFTGDAINLTQTSGDYLIFNCGTASSVI